MSNYSSYDSAPRTSTMAIISLVASILGLSAIPLLGSIVGVITGHMARREIKDSGGTLEGDGLAKAGLIIGYVGIGLTVLGICFALFVILLTTGIIGASLNSFVPLLLLAA